MQLKIEMKKKAANPFIIQRPRRINNRRKRETASAAGPPLPSSGHFCNHIPQTTSLNSPDSIEINSNQLQLESTSTFEIVVKCRRENDGLEKMDTRESTIINDRVIRWRAAAYAI